MNALLKYLEGSYFTDLASFLVALMGYLISFKIKQKDDNRILLKYYFLSFLILDVASYSTVGFLRHFPHLKTLVLRYMDFLFTLVEFLILIVFFQRLFANRRMERRIISCIKHVFMAVSISLCLVDIIWSSKLTRDTLQNLFTLQAVCLLVPSIFYYRTFFSDMPPANAIFDVAEFWIVAGISFFMLCTLPLSLFLNFLDSRLADLLYGIFYVFYCLLFLAFIRAFWCKCVTKSFDGKKHFI
jgi:hypothetical protein